MNKTLSGGAVTTIKKHPHMLKKYLVRTPRVACFSCQVDGAPIQDDDTKGVIAFHYKNESDDDLAFVLNDYTIDVGTSPGASDLGKYRNRKTINGMDKIIYVNETSIGEIPLKDGDYITIIKEHLIWQKRIRRVITGGSDDAPDYSEYVDYEVGYGGENEGHLVPITNITKDEDGNEVDYAGFVLPGEDYRIVDLSNFFSFHPGGLVIDTKQWHIGDCEFVGGDDMNTETIQIRVPIGYREIYCVCDITDGGLSFGWVPLVTLEDEDDPMLVKNFSVDQDQRQEGRIMSFSVKDDSVANLDKSNLMLYFELAWFGNAREEPPAQYIRQFRGWMLENSIKLRKRKGVYRLNLGGPQAVLNSLGGYPETVYDQRYPNFGGTVSAKWIEFPNNTPDKSVHYILRINTTALLVMNLFFSDYNPPIEGFTSIDTSIWQQVVGVTTRYFGVAACASGGSLYLVRHYDYLEDADRAARGAVIGINNTFWDDEQAPDLTTSAVDEYKQVDLYGSNYDISIDDADVIIDYTHVHRALAPGIVQGKGLSTDTPQDVFLQTGSGAQVQVAQWAGHHYARLNNKRKDVPFVLNGNYDVVEPAWGVPIAVTYTDTNIAGVTFTNMPFLVKNVSVSHQDSRGRDRKIVTWNTEQATTGNRALYIPEVLQSPDTQPYPPESRVPHYDGTDHFPTEIIEAESHRSEFWYATSLHYEDDIVVHDWQENSEGLGGWNIGMCTDPSDYGVVYLLQIADGDGNGAGLYRSQEPMNGEPWELVADYDAIGGGGDFTPRQIRMSINLDGYIAVSSLEKFAYTFNRGLTWHQTVVAGVEIRGFCLSSYNNDDEGWIWAGFWSYDEGEGYVYKSEDWGESWTKNLNITLSDGGQPNVPYIRSDGITPNINDNDQEIYVAQSYYLFRTRNNGLIWDSPWNLATATPAPLGASGYGQGIETFTWNGGIILIQSIFTPVIGYTIIYDLDGLAADMSGSIDGFGYVEDSLDLFPSGLAGVSQLHGYSTYKWARLLYNSEAYYFYFGFTQDAVVAIASGPHGILSTIGSLEWSLRSVVPPRVA